MSDTLRDNHWCMTGCELTAPCKPMTCKKAGIFEAPDDVALRARLAPTHPDDEALVAKFRAMAVRYGAAQISGQPWLKALAALDATTEEITCRLAELRRSDTAYRLIVDGWNKLVADKLAAEAALAECRDLLRQIGDAAHDASTGPAVPDKLWEIRSMAYDEL